MTLIKTDKNILTTSSNSFIDFLRKNPVVAANLLLVRDGEPLKLAPIQSVTLNEWWNSKFSLLTATRGSGKAVTIDTKVLTPSGWVYITELKIGDKILTPKGNESQITGIYPQGVIPTYEMIFNDGRTCKCSKDHLWTVKGYKCRHNSWTTITAEEIKTWSETYSRTAHCKIRIPLVENLFPQIKDKEFLIHPYILGTLIGDGCIRYRSIIISTSDQFILDKVSTLLPDSFKITKASGKYDYRITDLTCKKVGGKVGITKNRIMAKLERLELQGKYSYEKFIPDEYMNLNRKQTLELLQGLFDTDGTVNKSRGSRGNEITNNVSYCTTSKTLAHQIQYLIRKLGGLCKISMKHSVFTYNGVKKDGRTAYILSIRLKNKKELFSLPRKQKLLHEKDQYSENLSLSIDKINNIINQECICIKIDDPDGLFIIDDFIVTHNTFLSAVYIALRCLLYPNTRVGLFAPAFRQAKYIFNEFTRLYEDSPLLQQCIERPPTKLNDHCICEYKQVRQGIGKSTIKALPIGTDGSTIRGERVSCFQYDTLVVTESGLVALGDVVEHGNIQHILTPKGYVKPDKLIKNPPEDILEFTFKSGLTLKTSKDQKLLSKQKRITYNNLEEEVYLLVEAKNFQVGDNVVLDYSSKLHHIKDKYKLPPVVTSRQFAPKSRLSKELPSEIDEDLAEFLGFLIAEGSCTELSRLEIYQKAPELLYYFDKKLIKLFGKGLSISKKNKQTETKTFKGYRGQVTNRTIREYLLDIGLTRSKAYDKEIPFSIFSSPESIICAFLRGLYEGDGGVFFSNKNHKKFNSKNIHYKTVSKKLADQLQLILFSLGINNNRCILHPTNLKHKIQYSINIQQEQSIDIFYKKIGFLSKEKNNKLKEVINYFNNKHYIRDHGSFRLDEILNIQLLSNKEPTYDISLDTEDHLFYANNYIAHNCIIMDEVVHIPESIFRAAIQPMMSTSRNPMQRVSKLEKLSDQFGGEIPEEFLSTDNGYIGITSGFYQFNYWWTEILGFYNQVKRGSKLYNLRFIPYTELPEGFFEMDIVRDAQLNSPSHVFLTEWMAEWIADSEGAFPMSLLESCRDSSIIPRSSRDLNLDKSKQFIFGIDVARENDSSAIIIIELGGISKVVHIVELEEIPFPEQTKKIFELVEVFNPMMIYMDEFGGGQTLRDSLAKPESVGWSQSKKIITVDSDINHSGKRILKLCSPTSTFIEDSNNCAKILLEQGVIRFPTADHPIETTKKVNIKGVFKDVDLVQEMINQIASVVVSSTGQGRLHYDLPGTKAQSSTISLNVKKKDLYSAFILACRCVYDIQWQPKVDNLMVNVGVIKEIQTVSNSYKLTNRKTSDIIQTGNNRIVGEQPQEFKKIIPSGGIIVSRNGKTKR